MERKTYAGHGKPTEFTFYGTNPKGPTETGEKITWAKLSARNVDPITPNTKFWAEVPADPESVIKNLRRQLDEAKELAAGFEALEAALLERIRELEANGGPYVPKILDDLEAAGRDAAVRMEAIRKNRKASYADRLQCKFLEGMAKTSAWVLQEFAKFDN
jgi:hypothetical protein